MTTFAVAQCYLRLLQPGRRHHHYRLIPLLPVKILRFRSPYVPHDINGNCECLKALDSLILNTITLLPSMLCIPVLLLAGLASASTLQRRTTYCDQYE